MKNIIFDLGGVVVEWNAKRVIETFRGNPILVNFVRENRLFLNDWRDYDRGDVTRQELINKVAILSGCRTRSRRNCAGRGRKASAAGFSGR